MTSLKDMAKEYEAPQTKNISELEKVSVDIDVTEETHTNEKEGKDFTILVTIIDEEKYRVPKTVLGQLKAILEKMPETKSFRVLKDGEGLGTKYQVVPLN